ncbi:unnamed protein product [Arctogadus glacialis]
MAYDEEPGAPTHLGKQVIVAADGAGEWQPESSAWERGAYGGRVTLHVINLVKLHWQRGSSRGHMSLSVDGNT